MNKCACGCGNCVPLYRGKEHPFLHGHNRWKGGRQIDKQGRIYVYMPRHPRSGKNGYVFEHVLIVESILGKPLPKKAVIHHIDGKSWNNHPSNLTVCHDNIYHKMLHQRERALKECGHPGWLKCPYCKQYDNPQNMYIRPRGRSAYHAKCELAYQKNRRRKTCLKK